MGASPLPLTAGTVYNAMFKAMRRVAQDAPHPPWCDGTPRPIPSDCLADTLRMTLLVDGLIQPLLAGEPPEDCTDTDFARRRRRCRCRRCAIEVVETYESRAMGGDYVTRLCDRFPQPLLAHSHQTANGIARAFGLPLPYPEERFVRWSRLRVVV